MKRVLSLILVLVMLIGLMPTHTFAQGETADRFAGKKVSILSHSMSTYAGVSNNSAANSTIGNNDVYYTEGRLDVYQKDTWWQQVIDALGMELLVNNSWSGSCVFQPRKGEASVGYGDRAVNLHNDHTGEEPDIIFVYMGCNDFAYYKDTFGKAEDVNYDTLIQPNGDGTYTYAEPATTCEAYAIMLHKAACRYSNAEIYCITSTARRETDYAEDNYPDAGQPTEYSAQLQQIAAYFGCPVIDLENAIPKDVDIFDKYIGDKRAHANALGMDQITNEVLSVMLGEDAEICHVTAANGEAKEQAVLLGGCYEAELDLRDGYAVAVTMGGKDVTEEAVADGMIVIDMITGDIQVSSVIHREPQSFRWEIQNDTLLSVGDTGNALDQLAGTITDGVLENARFQMESPVVLKHDLPWEMEWQFSGNWRGCVFTSDPVQSTKDMVYLSRTAGGQLCFGTWNGSQYSNYGVDLSGLDGQNHTFRLENRISDDGSNMVWVYVDGEEIGPMNNYFIGSKDQGTTADWVSGKDFVFSYLSMDGHPLKDCKLEYIRVQENAHVHSYEDMITAPTCTEQGYTTYTCDCGDSYVNDYVDVLNHSFKNGICAVCNVSVLELNYTHAQPVNRGVANAIARAYQLTDVEWTPRADMPGVDKINGEYTVITYKAGETYKGIPYSGVIATDTYLGLNVSLESFLTALENTNSVLYTENLHSTNPKSATYFGTVCSKFAQYVLDIPGSYNTNNVANIPGVDTIAMPGQYTVDDIKLGDIVLHTQNHTSVCTDILYDANGNVAFVEISEAVFPQVRRKLWSPEEFYTHFSGYRLCRYQCVDDVPVAPAEIPADRQYALMPRFGDKYNYTVSSTKGIVDVLQSGYSKAVILRNGTVISEIDLNGASTFSFDRSIPGYLKMYLEKEDGTRSNSVYACVVKSSVSVTDASAFLSGNLSVSFDGSSGTPLYVQVGSGQSVFCSVENNQSGKATISFRPSLVSGEKVSVRVAYQNEYGIYLSSWVSFTVDYSAGTGTNPSSDPILSQGTYWNGYNITPSSHLPQVQEGKEGFWTYTMIPVEENTTYYSWGATRMWYLDANGNPITTINAYKDCSPSCQFTIPEGIAYVSIAYSPTLLSQGTETMTVVSSAPEEDEEEKGEEKEETPTNPSTDPYLSQGEYWDGYTLTPTNSTPSVQAGKENYWAYTMIPVEGNTTYYSNGANRMWFFDANEKPISTYNALTESAIRCQFTTPANACYVSITYAPTGIEKGKETMEKVMPEHTHSYESVVTAPTCTEQGYTTYTCACGDSYVADFRDATGEHVWSSWTVEVEPTCDTEGHDQRVCAVCGQKQKRDTRITGDQNKILVSDPVDADYFSGKTLLLIGDSITCGVGVNDRGTEVYGQIVGKDLGMTVVNKGVSGSGYCSGGAMSTNKTLTEANVRNADVITIMLGVNDWTWAVKDGSWNGKPEYYDKSQTYYQLGDFNSTDTSTLYGALHSWCQSIVSMKQTPGFENKQFVVVTPLITSWNTSVGKKDWNQDKVSIHGHTFREHCTAIMEVCAYYDIPVFDANMFSGVYYKSAEDNNVTETGGDGVHINAAGHALLADALEEFLLEGYSYESRTVEYGGHTYENGVCLDCRLPYACKHVYSFVVTAPTCTEAGYTTYTCACGDSYVGNYVDAEGGHDFTDWYITREATYAQAGEACRDCKKCSHVEFRAVEVEVVTSGNVGYGTPYTDAVTYTLYADGTMVIAGSGYVYCSDWRGNNQPYYDYREQVKNLIIEEGVTQTMGGCFAYFVNLECVSIPASLTKINKNAFMNSFDSSITSITIPETVTYLADYAFGFYSGASSATFTDVIIENPNVGFHASNAVFNSGKKLQNLTLYSYGSENNVRTYAETYGCRYIDLNNYQKGETGDVHYEVSSGVLTLDPLVENAVIPAANQPWASFNDQITKIVISDGIATIPDYAFADYTALMEVTLPYTIQSIGDAAFSVSESNTTSLTMTIPRRVASLGEDLFDGRSNVHLTVYYDSLGAGIDEAGVVLDVKKEFKLLLIGNSYSEDASNGSHTKTSQLLDILQSMLGQNTEITVALLYSGGKGMHWHATQAEQNNSAYSFKVISTANPTWKSLGSYTSADALSWTDWDAVSLQPYNINVSTGQESVPYPDTTDPKFYHIEDSSTYLLDHVDRYAPYAEIYFYMHWAQTSGTTLNAVLSSYNKSAAFMPQVLEYAGTESGAKFKTIIPVGLSIQNARTTYLALLRYNTTAYADGNLNLTTDAQIGLQRDGGHVSFNIGRYIAALTFAETIIPEQMREDEYVLPDIRVTESVGRLPKEYSVIAQKAVQAAVNGWKQGSLAVTNIEGYTQDPTVAASEKLETLSLRLSRGDNDALVEQITDAVLAELPADFAVDAVDVNEIANSAAVTIRFGYTSVTVNVSFLIVEPVINQQPESVEQEIGKKFAITVQAEGDGLTYQWYYKDAGMKNFGISSNKTSSYAYYMQKYMHNRQVYCVITDKYGNQLTTETATITRPPLELTIVEQPQGVQVNVGDKFSIKPKVEGDGLTYQWYVKESGAKAFKVSSNKTSAYAYTMQGYMKGRQVYCVITDMYGNSVTTDVATISLPPVELKILTQPTDVSASVGTKFSISFEVQGDGLTYQWYVKESGAKAFKVSSNKTSAYAYAMQSYMNNRQVYCVITDQYGNQVTTEVVTIYLER